MHNQVKVCTHKYGIVTKDICLCLEKIYIWWIYLVKIYLVNIYLVNIYLDFRTNSYKKTLVGVRQKFSTRAFFFFFFFHFKFTFRDECRNPTQAQRQGPLWNGLVCWQVADLLCWFQTKSYHRHLTKHHFWLHIQIMSNFLQVVCEYEGSQWCIAIVISYHHLDTFRRNTHIHSPNEDVYLQCHFLCEFVRRTCAVQGMSA